MGLKTALVRALITLIFTTIIPLGGNAVARANGIFLLLINENTILSVGLLLTILIFIQTYIKRPKVKSAIGSVGTLIRLWYFLLFLMMVTSISIPSINSEVEVEYMGTMGDVPGHLGSTLATILTDDKLTFPVLGDLIILTFALQFVRNILQWFDSPKKKRNEEVKEILKEARVD